jgi:hypothetical protein
MNWIEVTKNMTQWLVLVNTVISLWVPQAEFLISRAIISFSGINMAHGTEVIAISRSLNYTTLLQPSIGKYYPIIVKKEVFLCKNIFSVICNFEIRGI